MSTFNPPPARPPSSASNQPPRLARAASPSPSAAPSPSASSPTPPNSPPRTPSRLPKPRQPSLSDSSSHIHHLHRRTPSSSASASFAAALTGPLPPFPEPIVLSQASQSMERRVSGAPGPGASAGPPGSPQGPHRSPQQARKPFLPCLQDPHPHPLVCTGPTPSAGMHAQTQAQVQAGLGNGRPQPRIRTASAPQGPHSRGSSVSPRQSSYSSPLFGPGALAGGGSRSASSSAATTAHPSPASAPNGHALHPVPKRGSCSKLSRPPIQPRSTSYASHMTYTSFDIRPPQTPGEEDEDSEPRGASWLASWLGRGRAKGKGSREDEESVLGSEATSKTVGSSAMIERGERTPLLAGQRGERERDAQGEPLPKLSRECLVAEIKCYGFYMLPPLILFVGLALTVALWVYTREIDNLGRFISDAYDSVVTAVTFFRW